jgi:sulfate/thiosulfate transport system permease protein
LLLLSKSKFAILRYLANNNKIMQKNILPGFNLTLGYTLLYLLTLVILPLSYLFWGLWHTSLAQFTFLITNERIIHAFKLSISCAFLATLINTFCGFILAWVLARYEFYGRGFIDAIIDLPFALPTAIAGISLATIYSKEGVIGKLFSGIKIAYTPLGIVIAMVFIGIPFMVRAVEPVIRNLPKELESCALSLGASKWQSFYLITLPQIIPAMMTGFGLTFAKALGEYGSVIFIAGNIQKYSEIVPLLINIELEQFNYQAAEVIAILMLIISFALLFVINILQRFMRK